MTKFDNNELKIASQAFAFLGNSLLNAMNQTESVGLSADFWHDFPDLGEKKVRDAADNMASFVSGLSDLKQEEAVIQVSVEYTRLFIGPPSPAAAPWETFYRGDGTNVGFGQATTEMRALLNNAGLKLQNANHQYEDHIGIELLYLSWLCSTAGESPEEVDITDIDTYISDHPGSWISKLREKVAQSDPDGYIAGLLHVTAALLDVFHS